MRTRILRQMPAENASRTKADGDKTQRKRRQNEDENLSQVENEKQKINEKTKIPNETTGKKAR